MLAVHCLLLIKLMELFGAIRIKAETSRHESNKCGCIQRAGTLIAPS